MSRMRFLIIFLLVAGVFFIGSRVFQEFPLLSGSKLSDTSVQTSKVTSTPVSYAASLGLMQGHLLVAKELLDQGTPAQAEPHLGHPVDELYDLVEKQLREYDAPEFREELDYIYKLAKYKPANPEIQTGYENSVKAIDSAINKLPPEELQSPQFLDQVIYEMLHTAEVEYKAGIANNKVVARIEYQDARGFVFYTEGFYEEFYKNTWPNSSLISSSIKNLKKAFPSVNPPEPPTLSPSDFSEEVDKLKQA
ncbi:MAG: hypothetical protein F6K26_11750 [Moorea sp. SIO2I5]|nr:hypothetical protein [Moorena sp. SIO2I5]